MKVLVDTSIWIDYFKGAQNSVGLDFLIDENLIVTNDIILAELLPHLTIKRNFKLISLLREIEPLPIQINWQEIIGFQVKCLENGINGIGLPDLIIAQNANDNSCSVYSLDKHFRLLNQVMDVQIYE